MLVDDGTIDFDQRRLGRLVSRHLPLIAACVLAGVLLAVVLSALRGTTYTATSQLRVAAPLTLTDVLGTTPSSTRAAVAVDDQIGVLKSDDISGRVRTILGSRGDYSASFANSGSGEVVNVTVTSPKRATARDAANAYTKAYLDQLAERNKPLFDAALAQLNGDINAVNRQVDTLSRTLGSATSTNLEQVRAQIGENQTQLLQRRSDLQGQLDSVRLAAAVSPSGNASVVSEPTTSKSGGLFRDLLLGAVVGLLVGLALATARETRSGRIVEGEDAEAAGLQVAAEAPVALIRNVRTASAALGAGDDAAGYRRAAVVLAPPHAASVPRRWLVTSPDSDGVPAAVLAGRLARQVSGLGRKVVLVDFDAQSPESGRQPGLAEVLLGEVPIGNGLVKDAASGVTVMTAGTNLGRLREPVASPTFAGLLDTLSEAFDVVILTGAELERSADAYVLLPLVNLVVVALHRNATRRSAVQKLLVRLEPVLGEAQLTSVLVGGRKTRGPEGPTRGLPAKSPATSRSSARRGLVLDGVPAIGRG